MAFEIPKEAVDALYEPLNDDDMRALLCAIRAYRGQDGGVVKAMSSAANKIEARLHLSVTGHRIYEGPGSAAAVTAGRMRARAAEAQRKADVLARNAASLRASADSLDAARVAIPADEDDSAFSHGAPDDQSV